MAEQDWSEDIQPRFVETIRDHLQRYGVMKVITMRGEGSYGSPANFQLFGAGPPDRALILDVYLRILVATQHFPDEIKPHVDKTYKLAHHADGRPKLVHGFTITGSVRNKDDADALLEALDLAEYFQSGSRDVDTARFYVPDGMGGVMPSPERNVPVSGGNAPDGSQGMRGVYPIRNNPGGTRT
jgi:hypothetical protein